VNIDGRPAGEVCCVHRLEMAGREVHVNGRVVVGAAAPGEAFAGT
jgi:hypothetical protein